MDAAQDGLCMICRLRPPAQGGKSDALHVDHCHATNTVRDLLCWRCNTALGLFGEDIPTMESAIAYLKRWQASDEPR